MTNVWFALGLTVFAGPATGVGNAIAFFAKRTNDRFLSVSTGFSAGGNWENIFWLIIPTVSWVNDHLPFGYKNGDQAESC